MNQQLTLRAGAILGFIAVATGAFGAHALKPMLLQSGRLETYELAVRYQFYHAITLIAVAALMQINISLRLKYAALSFVIGVVLFSGSLFALAFTKLGVLGVITPIGGLFLLIGWAFLALSITKKNSL
jgi:uncharacterized membrane protein YgdD (TMEM256/DUF423 family)